MLVITRKPGEAIVIDSSGVTIEITVIETAKGQTKLGVSAPKEVKIMRSELLAVESSNVEASQAIPKGALDALLQIKKK